MSPNGAGPSVSEEVPDCGGEFGNPFSSSDSPRSMLPDKQYPMLENCDREAGLDLPCGLPYPLNRVWRVMRLQHCTYPEVQARKLALFSGDRAYSIRTGLPAGLAAVLSRCTGQDKPSIGSTHLQVDLDKVQMPASAGADLRISWLDLSEDPSYEEVLRRKREVVLQGFERWALPLEHLLNGLRKQLVLTISHQSEKLSLALRAWPFSEKNAHGA